MTGRRNLSVKSSKKIKKAPKEIIVYQAPTLDFRNRFGKIGWFLGLIGKPFFYFAFYTGYLSLYFLALWTIILRRTKNLSFPKFNLPGPKLSTKTILITFITIIFPLILLSTLALRSFLKDLPNPNELSSRQQAISTKIYDRNGVLLYKIYKGQNRSIVKLDQIPLFLRQATIAVEDSTFYSHHGLDFRGISRSFYRNLFSNRLSGGSTITQQLVKNALLSPERTWNRKIKEVFLSLWVEKEYSKDEILEMYLNEVSYGGSAYGVEEASQLYFGKSVKDLTVSEAALIASLPASPTNYSPFGANPELAKKQQEKVIQRMVEEGYLTMETAKKVKEEKLKYAPQKTNILAPHFVMYVKDLLVKKYGDRVVESGGLEVKTSLDLSAQETAEKIVSHEIDKLESLHVSNGAALVTNPKTGEILAMVGSRDYFNHDNGNFNVTTAARQPGSSIKPVNYAVALANGFTPATIIPDTPITYQVPGQPPYTPRNYDNRFHGNVPLRVALASSYNVPAVKVLSAFGVSRMIEQGQKMGITTWDDPSRFGLSLTLGGGEVKMTDMAVVYGTLANRGMRVDLNPILEVKDYKGRVLQKLPCEAGSCSAGEIEGQRALSPQIAYLLTDILADNNARTPTFGPRSQLVVPNHTVAVKTGTTNNLKDNWTIGYTPSLLSVVWVGNNDNSPMSYVASGVTGASPIWHNIMAELLKDQPNEEFDVPSGLVKVSICSVTGTLPCNGCPTHDEWFIAGTEPQTSCSPVQLLPTVTPTI
ncbi:MAG: PBP1A family penicillin-binding protein [bacterium]|nr:PBP1A family penicillin-binding protein [bacterium]